MQTFTQTPRRQISPSLPGSLGNRASDTCQNVSRGDDSISMDERENLLLAIDHLPEEIRVWLGVALATGRQTVGALSYANDVAVCPIVAAALEAGVWNGDHIAAGNLVWGTPDG